MSPFTTHESGTRGCYHDGRSFAHYTLHEASKSVEVIMMVEDVYVGVVSHIMTVSILQLHYCIISQSYLFLLMK